jgi:hypothetical protein
MEKITNAEIAHALEMFWQAVECMPSGACLPDEVHIVASKNYVVFISPRGDEVRLIRDDKSVHLIVKAGNYKLVTDSWDMFTLKSGKRVIYSPRIVIGRETYTTDELIEYVRKGFKALLNAVNWV